MKRQNLQGQVVGLEAENIHLKNENERLQIRIDKAIKYINENSAFLENDEYEVLNKKELLDILQGSDKE